MFCLLQYLWIQLTHLVTRYFRPYLQCMRVFWWKKIPFKLENRYFPNLLADPGDKFSVQVNFQCTQMSTRGKNTGCQRSRVLFRLGRVLVLGNFLGCSEVGGVFFGSVFCCCCTVLFFSNQGSIRRKPFQVKNTAHITMIICHVIAKY